MAKFKQPMLAGNTNAHKHGADGTLRRIQQGRELAPSDQQLKNEIIVAMGYSFDALPAGPLGVAIDRVASNVLVALKFEGAVAWAESEGTTADIERLLNKLRQTNDSAIKQLLDLTRMQTTDDNTVILDAITSAKDGGENTP